MGVGGSTLPALILRHRTEQSGSSCCPLLRVITELVLSKLVGVREEPRSVLLPRDISSILILPFLGIMVTTKHLLLHLGP